MTTEEQIANPKPSEANGSMSGFRVEARCTSQPQVLNKDFVLDKTWREVPFSIRAPIGVPNGPSFHAHELEQASCYGFAAAQALRWWFIADLARDFRELCVETRLIEYKIHYHRTYKPVAIHCEVLENMEPRGAHSARPNDV